MAYIVKKHTPMLVFSKKSVYLQGDGVAGLGGGRCKMLICNYIFK